MKGPNVSESPVRELLDQGRLSLADACRAIRSLQDVSQDEFAKRLGINRKVVKDLESGRGNPGWKSLSRIAAAAGLQVAFVHNPYPVGIMNSRKRLSEERARRAADASALEKGLSEQELHRRNAMSLGGLELALPKIS